MTEETEEFPLNGKLEESIQKKTTDAYEVALKECDTTIFRDTTILWDKGVQEVVDRELNKNLTQEEKQYSKEKDEYSAAKTMKMLSDMEKEEKEKQNPARMDYNEMRRTAKQISYGLQREREQKEYRENVAKTAENTAKIAENTAKKRKAVIMASVGTFFLTIVMYTIIGVLTGDGDALILSFIKYLWFLIPTW